MKLSIKAQRNLRRLIVLIIGIILIGLLDWKWMIPFAIGYLIAMESWS